VNVGTRVGVIVAVGRTNPAGVGVQHQDVDGENVAEAVRLGLGVRVGATVRVAVGTRVGHEIGVGIGGNRPTVGVGAVGALGARLHGAYQSTSAKITATA
jgi:hypothetical protein